MFIILDLYPRKIIKKKGRLIGATVFIINRWCTLNIKTDVKTMLVIIVYDRNRGTSMNGLL